ncbi:hypothetical protein GGF31_008201 [Allomyces arbusculus]|nr:hypothetical protein GGF31_008201 [Allomyces arbusculus]
MSTTGPPLDPDTLKQQNDQLWRLVERQRQVIFQLREELERALGGSSVVGAPTQASPAQASPASLATPSPALPAAAPSLAVLPPRTTSTNTAASASSSLPPILPPRSAHYASPLTTPATAVATPPTPASLGPAGPATPTTAAPAAASPAAAPASQTSPPTQTQLAHLRTSLHRLSLPVLGAFIGPNAKGKEVMYIVVSVRVHEQPPAPLGAPAFTEFWCVAKTYADLVALETKCRAAHKVHPQLATMARLPDKAVFAPGRGPEPGREASAAVELFLGQLLAAVVEFPFGPMTHQLVEFISTDLHDPTTTLFQATAAAAAAAAAAGGNGSVPSTPVTEEPPPSSGGGLASAFGRLRLGGASAAHAASSARNHAGKLVAGSSPLARSSSSNPPTPRAPVFGVSLERAIAASRIKEGYELPAVVYRCIEYLDSQDAKNEEGIYRLSGSSATIRALKDRFNAEGDVDLCASNDYIDVHAVAGLLKLFFRELPGSLLTDQFHPYFVALQEVADINDRVAELSLLINMLPLPNYTVLRALISHLVTVVTNSDVNKMTVRNIGIVFAPTLGIPAGIFALMLMRFNDVFDVETGRKYLEEREARRRAAAIAASPADSTADSTAAVLAPAAEGGDANASNAAPVPPSSSDGRNDLVDLVGEYDGTPQVAAIHASGIDVSRDGSLEIESAQGVSPPNGSGLGTHDDVDLDDAAAAAAAPNARNSIIYSQAAPEAMLHLERSLTPVVVDDDHVDLDTDPSPEPVAAAAAAPLAPPPPRAHARLSAGYLDYYAGTEAVQYLQYLDEVGPDAPASLPRRIAPPARGDSHGAVLGSSPGSISSLNAVAAQQGGAAPPRGNSRSNKRESVYLAAHQYQEWSNPKRQSAVPAVPAMSPASLQQAEASLQALLQTDPGSLSRELAHMDPAALATLQALLVERTQQQAGQGQGQQGAQGTQQKSG